MSKIKIFSCTDVKINEQKVKDFIENKKVIDIINLKCDGNFITWASKIKVIYEEVN